MMIDYEMKKSQSKFIKDFIYNKINVSNNFSSGYAGCVTAPCTPSRGFSDMKG